MTKQCNFPSSSPLSRFFVPTIMELRKTNNLSLLCLSKGDADGLGSIRSKELDVSCKYLGFQDWDVIDDPNL